MITALLILGAVSLFVTLVAIIVNIMMVVMLQRDSRDLLTLVKVNTGRLATVEKLTVSLHSIISADITQSALESTPPAGAIPGNFRRVFRTEDGRHQADNFEDLLHKIADDERYRIAKPNDIDQLRKAFEDYQSRMNDDEEDLSSDEWKRDDKDGPETK